MWTTGLEKRLSAVAGRPIEVMQVGLSQYGQDKVLLFGFDNRGKAPVLVCRLTRSARGRRLLYREAAARIHAWNRVPSEIRAGMPRLEVMRVPAGVCLVESYVPGKAPLVARVPGEIERSARQSFAWLSAFQRATAQVPPRGPIVSRMAASFIAQAHQTFVDPRIVGVLHDLRPRLDLLDTVAPCTVHGDFWPGNFRTRAREFNVIDWEFARRYGSPWFDPVVNLISLAFELPARDKGESFERCFLEPSQTARMLGALLDTFPGGPGSRDAWSLAVVLAVAELVSRWPKGPGASPKYPSLQRLVARKDPVLAVRQALWSR